MSRAAVIPPPAVYGAQFAAAQTDFTARYGPANPTEDAVVRREDSPLKNEPIIKEAYGPD